MVGTQIVLEMGGPAFTRIHILMNKNLQFSSLDGWTSVVFIGWYSQTNYSRIGSPGGGFRLVSLGVDLELKAVCLYLDGSIEMRVCLEQLFETIIIDHIIYTSMDKTF